VNRCPVCGVEVVELPARMAAPAQFVAESVPAPEAPDRASARPASRAGAVSGVARSIQQRSEQSGGAQETEQIVTFRIERYDSEGQALPPVPVEMRGLSFEGVLSDGDWVEASGDWRPGRTLKPRAVHNLTTGATFQSRRRSRVVVAIQVVFMLFVVGFILTVFVILAGSFFSGSP
jgi:hypothetical protein